MSFFFTPANKTEVDYGISFTPLTLGPSYVPLYLSKETPSEYIRNCLINSLECVLNSNLIARKKGQQLIRAYDKIERMLRIKYPQDFWDAQNIRDLALLLLKKENWKLPLCDFLNYKI